jgi:hypothetical protein
MPAPWAGNFFDEVETPPEGTAFNVPYRGDRVIDFLAVEQYHEICSWNQYKNHTWCSALPLTINLGGIYFSPSGEFETAVEIASVPEIEVDWFGWYVRDTEGEEMENGWTRYVTHFSCPRPCANLQNPSAESAVVGGGIDATPPKSRPQ